MSLNMVHHQLTTTTSREPGDLHQMVQDHDAPAWIFGYGSLVWKPGFQFTKCIVGHVKGYKRRFWQGNTVHRGTPEKPGRVVTVVEDSESETWGLAFQMADASSALSYLDTRESYLGGYRTSLATFHPKGTSSRPFHVLMYVGGGATTNRHPPTNAPNYEPGSVGDMYLGPAPLEDLADQVISAQGNCGHNVEYVLRLADFMRSFAPGVEDTHLFALEHLVLQRLKDMKCDLSTFFPSLPPICRVNHVENTHVNASQPAPKKLRCLNM